MKCKTHNVYSRCHAGPITACLSGNDFCISIGTNFCCCRWIANSQQASSLAFSSSGASLWPSAADILIHLLGGFLWSHFQISSGHLLALRSWFFFPLKRPLQAAGRLSFCFWEDGGFYLQDCAPTWDSLPRSKQLFHPDLPSRWIKSSQRQTLAAEVLLCTYEAEPSPQQPSLMYILWLGKKKNNHKLFLNFLFQTPSSRREFVLTKLFF